LIVRSLAAFSLFAAVACPATLWAKKPDPPPPSVGRDPRTWANGQGWHLRIGHAQRDTLATSLRTALLAARFALEDDHWEVEPSRRASRHLTTQWKPIHNFIFRLFSGKAFGRCFVAVRPLPRDRVEVTFQAGLATRRDIEHNPAKGFAERSYAKAARDWQRDVRVLVADRLSGRRLGDERGK